MGALPSPIELTFPAEYRFVALARVLASSVAMTCGLLVDEIEDLRPTDHVLGVLADEHRAGREDERLRFVISTRLRVGGVG